MAPALQHLIASHELPRQGSDEHSLLLTFVALQSLRTERAAAQAAAALHPVLQEYLHLVGDKAGLDTSGVELHLRRPQLLTLQALEPFIIGTSDLVPLLLQAPRHLEFITSDNPVIMYNTFCEGVDYRGVTGVACAGLQIFLPLAPTLALALVDPVAYGPRRDLCSSALRATPHDVRQINLLQVIGADKVLFYRGSDMPRALPRLLAGAVRHRAAPLARFDEFDEVGGGNSVVFQSYSPMPNINLQLSFLDIRNDALSIPLHERAAMLRPIIQHVRQHMDAPDGARETFRSRQFVRRRRSPQTG